MPVLQHAYSIQQSRIHTVSCNWSVAQLDMDGSEHMPCITVETHNYALDTSAILRASAFCEQFINLFLSGVETQVTNLVKKSQV